jgi:hypothetical protein
LRTSTSRDIFSCPKYRTNFLNLHSSPFGNHLCQSSTLSAPSIPLFGVARHGKMHRFAFDVNSGFTGYKVEKLLRRYGVRVWGRQVSGSRTLLSSQTKSSRLG